MKDLELIQSTINHYRSRAMEDILRYGVSMWGKFKPPTKPSRFQIVKHKFRSAFYRIHDAYLVLIGWAEIEEDDE